MKKFTLPALILALGSTMIAAPQAGTKKAPARPPAASSPLPTDAKSTTAKEGRKPKTKRVKKDAKDKVTHDAHK